MRGVFVFNRLLPSQKDVQDNVATLGVLCVGARCVFVFIGVSCKIFQSERNSFPENPAMAGGKHFGDARYGGLPVWDECGANEVRMGLRIVRDPPGPPPGGVR